MIAIVHSVSSLVCHSHKSIINVVEVWWAKNDVEPNLVVHVRLPLPVKITRAILGKRRLCAR